MELCVVDGQKWYRNTLKRTLCIQLSYLDVQHVTRQEAVVPLAVEQSPFAPHVSATHRKFLYLSILFPVSNLLKITEQKMQQNDAVAIMSVDMQLHLGVRTYSCD